MLGPCAVSGPRLRPAVATCSVESGGPTALGVAPTLQQSGRGPLSAPVCHHHALGMVFRKVSSAIKLGWVLALHLPTVTLRCYFTVLIPGALCTRTVRIHTHTHTCIHARTCTRTHIRTHMHAHACTCMHVCTHTHALVRARASLRA